MAYRGSLFQSGFRGAEIIPDPGAGNEWSFTPQANQAVELTGISFTLTTAGGGPARELLLNFTSTLFPGFNFPVVIPAPIANGTTHTISMLRGVDTGTSFTSNDVININLPEIFFSPTTTLSSLLLGMQAGDAYTDIIVVYRIFNPDA